MADLAIGTTETTRVGGFNTLRTTRRGLAEMMVADCRKRDSLVGPKLIFSSNGQGIALAAQDADFARTMDAADVIHADGMSVVISSRLLTKKPLPERVATTDFFEDAVEKAIEAGLSFYFLGGTESQNAKAVEVVRERYPALKIAGRRNGYFKPEDDIDICNAIRESGTDVLWVALGKPLQEKWSVRNRKNLAGVGWIKTCGGLFGHLVGDEKRAPRWMQRLGLEWLYRVWQDPRRLAWRYLTTNPYAMWSIVKDAFASGGARN
jgi:exopolysaccharide biosynthesis WecB/TagA/CpsF family protein